MKAMAEFVKNILLVIGVGVAVPALARPSLTAGIAFLEGRGTFSDRIDGRGFSVEFDRETGGIRSLKLNGDLAGMNWFEGARKWGTLNDFVCRDVMRTADGIRVLYERGCVTAEVARIIRPDGRLDETYVIRNGGISPVTFGRGDLGIAATFNDSYDRADICVSNRCHAHVWCGGEASWVHAKKMGPFPTELALVLREGSLDSYSVKRMQMGWSNDRGDFILHPDPFTLAPGESKRLMWTVLAFPEGHFVEALCGVGGAFVSFDQETVFPGEPFVVTKTHGDGKGGLVHEVERIPDDGGFGERKMSFMVGGRIMRAVGYRCPDFEMLVSNRVRRIIAENQMDEPGSQFDGAFVIYDYENGCRYVENSTGGDRSATQERVGMALLLARWLENHRDDTAVSGALARWECFLVREFWDKKTGWVTCGVGHAEQGARLYNVPWIVDYWLERWYATGDRLYLDRMALTLRAYYDKGGECHYPNAAFLAEAIKVLQDAGCEVDDIRAAFDRQVVNIVRKGPIYPPHEVNFEQTIASPAAHLTTTSCRFWPGDSEIAEAAALQIGMLSRFDGEQPHHRLSQIPIRHWDGYWAGKRQLYGDTFPHYWATLSGNAYLCYGETFGDKTYLEKGRRNLRNCLCNYREDGTARCAYIFPYSVTMTGADEQGRPYDFGRPRLGEYEDPWSNDQDFGLYIILRNWEFVRGNRGRSLNKESK